MFCAGLFAPLPNPLCLRVWILYVEPSADVVKRLIHCREGGKGSQKVLSLPKELPSSCDTCVPFRWLYLAVDLHAWISRYAIFISLLCSLSLTVEKQSLSVMYQQIGISLKDFQPLNVWNCSSFSKVGNQSDFYILYILCKLSVFI